MDGDNSLEVIEQLYETEYFATFRVRQHNRELRLTRMSAELSESTFFRAGFRKDQPNLANLNHRGILRFVGWGEEHGQLYYLTELPVGQTLEDSLVSDRQFSLDEVIDICWQLTSALQHAHNQGIAHGHLRTSSIIISESIGVQIAGFGLYRWIAETREKKISRWSDLVNSDLIELAKIMDVLAQHVGDQSVEYSESQHETLKQIIETIELSSTTMTARDIQGLLGNLLLQVAGDSISLVDHRHGQGVSRRSIIDELFDDVTESRQSGRGSRGKSGCFAFVGKLFLGALIGFLVLQSVS